MKARPVVVLGVLAVLAALTLAVGPLVGGRWVSPAAAFAGDPTARTILWTLRLPRVLLALLGGGVLAVAGVAFQTLFRNPLAEPYTLGVASGAALGAVAVLLSPLPVLWIGLPLVAAASFAGALAVTALVVGVARSRSGVETATLLLAGIAISLSCSALILLLQYFADFTRTYRIVRWMMGGLEVVGYREVLWLAPWAGGGLMWLAGRRWELNLLLTGEELAAGRGADVARLRAELLVVASLMVGALVAVAGPIGFVGLIVPHIVRRFVGADHLYLVPACALAGGVFLALCDVAARTLLAPAELPVGVLTALMGGPFFLWLLLGRGRGWRR